ncbi:MAG TPA: GNAT family protein [Thermoanaerobaculia bacterium]|nr:GNAT family protein [Thermoanaerobaculia bacterium]
MNVEPVRLEGSIVTLEPLEPRHAPALFRVHDPEIFRYTLDFPTDPGFEAFAAYIDRCRTAPASLDFAMIGPDGEPIGCSAYLEIRPAHRGLEIGRTWISRAWQGTRVNPESKYLLLRHAFEVLGAIRVQLKTDVRNAHSQRAIEKLGARREGVLRNFQIRANGLPRDTVMYSLVADEWPEVKARLEERLSRG